MIEAHAALHRGVDLSSKSRAHRANAHSRRVVAEEVIGWGGHREIPTCVIYSKLAIILLRGQKFIIIARFLTPRN